MVNHGSALGKSVQPGSPHKSWLLVLGFQRPRAHGLRWEVWDNAQRSWDMSTSTCTEGRLGGLLRAKQSPRVVVFRLLCAQHAWVERVSCDAPVACCLSKIVDWYSIHYDVWLGSSCAFIKSNDVARCYRYTLVQAPTLSGPKLASPLFACRGLGPYQIYAPLFTG